MLSRKLNVGCGNDVREGWLNIDRNVPAKLTGEDLANGLFMVGDLGKVDPGAQGGRLDLPTSHFEELEMSHVIEHLSNPLQVLEELWRVATPGAKLTIRCPHGSSDDAWEDQTHVRAYFEGSWNAFAQPYYWRAHYGYMGDWQPREVVLFLAPAEEWPFLMVPESTNDLPPAELHRMLRQHRNLVREMVVELVAVKPAREPLRELLQAHRVALSW